MINEYQGINPEFIPLFLLTFFASIGIALALRKKTARFILLVEFILSIVGVGWAFAFEILTWKLNWFDNDQLTVFIFSSGILASILLMIFGLIQLISTALGVKKQSGTQALIIVGILGIFLFFVGYVVSNLILLQTGLHHCPPVLFSTHAQFCM